MLLTISITDEEQSSRKREIIDASVLGLIFEKLNGYKDGAVYTPSVITEYMCKYTIEKSVLNNINRHFGWKCSDFDEIKFNITSPKIAKEINEVINSLKICDIILQSLIQCRGIIEKCAFAV